MILLKQAFKDRNALIHYVQDLAPWARGEASPIKGGHDRAEKTLKASDPLHYGKTRNYGDGCVTKLSPFVHHGLITLHDIRKEALQKCPKPQHITKFIQELSWRDFWQRVADQNPTWIWQDVEAYKTGFTHEDYANDLPEDIQKGNTGVACLDAFIHDLVKTGYVHNHGRMYLASYVVHFRRIKWQAGARWFLEHLLDGDEASNNFSWQWIASTFSNKPYIFNLENVRKYFGSLVNTSPEKNQVLDASYDDLSRRLFPKMGRVDV